MTYVARTKNDLLRGRNNAAADTYREVILSCGHEAHGSPTMLSPDRYWCQECRAFHGVKGARKRAA